MIQIDDVFVDSVAPNANAAKNGRKLVQQKKLQRLCKSKDETLLFGECTGSGKSAYATSADFIDPDKPVFRCSCPSRQFPCKHTLGLMYAFAQGQTFQTEAIPESILEKRKKAEKRAETREKKAAAPRKVNKSALKKKIKAQLEGLDLLDTLTGDLIRSGLGVMNPKTARQIEEQAKQLGNSYLPGAQTALRGLTMLFRNTRGTLGEDVYAEALDQLICLSAICRRGREYLNRRLADPELAPDTDSTIAAWLGHAWQIREMRDMGMVQENAELVQLAFRSENDPARQEFVETGIWVNLSDGRVELTQNFRPYRAAGQIREEDAVYDVAQVKELFIYPGDMNPRVRWEEMSPRSPETADYRKIRSFAEKGFAPAVKAVKSQIKSPLADKSPLMLLHYRRIGIAENVLVMEDTSGDRLVLADSPSATDPGTCHLFSLLSPEYLQNQVLLVRFHHNLVTRQLLAEPLTIVTETEIVRMGY